MVDTGHATRTDIAVDIEGHRFSISGRFLDGLAMPCVIRRAWWVMSTSRARNRSR